MIKLIINGKEIYKDESVRLQELAKELGIECILTSDSHRGRKDDFASYIKMHEIAGHNLEQIEETYKERYMPKPFEMFERFVKMHKGDFGLDKARKFASDMYSNLDYIEDKCEDCFHFVYFAYGRCVQNIVLQLHCFTKYGKFFEKALYQASCKASIKAGRVYDREHIKWICDKVLTFDNIKYCPHGRPVAFEITKHFLEKQFERIK